MALTITKIGSEIVTEKLTFQCVSDDPSVTSVLMTVRLETGVDNHALEHLPDFGTTDTFTFEVNSILKDYFDFEFQPLTGSGLSVIENVIFKVIFNEVIDTVIQGVDYTSNGIAKNITQDVFEIEDFDIAEYDCGTGGSSASKLLTSSPSPLVMGDLTSTFVSALSTSYSGTPPALTPLQEWVIEKYDASGVLVNATFEDVTVPVRSIDGLSLIGAFDIATLKVDMDTSTGYYETRVYIRDKAAPNTVRSETKIFKLNDACERAITLSWYNEFGTQDTFTFLGNINRVGKYTDSSFKRVRPVNPLSTNVGDLVYKSSYNYEYDIYSDRMPQSQVQWLSKMLINKRAAIQGAKVLPVYTGTVATNQLASPITGSQQQGVTIDGGNGFMYVVPFVSDDILKINISTGVVTSFSSGFGSGTPKWFTAEKGTNGNLYFIPFYEDDILVVDPSNDTTSTLTVPTSIGFYQKWFTSAITSSGVIYAFPSIGGATSNVLKIDTNTNTVTEVVGVTGEYEACGLSSNGYIYAAGIGNQVLKFNTATDTGVNIGIALVGAIRCQSLFELNNIMYIFGETNLYKLNTLTDGITTESIGSVNMLVGWNDVVLALDGNFYLPPSDGIDFLQKYDPILNTTTSVATIESDPRWASVGISSTGIMYGIPNKTNEILEITLGVSTAGTSQKYFPILITTEETTLEDKFAPETLFRLKFRLANRRKGLK